MPDDTAARAAHANGDFKGCLEEALRLYGDELEGWVSAQLGPYGEFDEAWSATCIALLEGLPRFEWRCSLRTWLYQVARHTLWAQKRADGRAQMVPFSQVSRPSALAARQPSTPSFLSAQTEARVDALRASLEPDDRALLYLRVDRGLSWAEVLEVLEPDDAADADRARTATARLRKRFERLTEKLRAVLRSTSE